MGDYNYVNFPLDLEHDTFEAFADGLRAGDAAPDGELTDAATGERALLSSFCKPGPTVVEFGSLT